MIYTVKRIDEDLDFVYEKLKKEEETVDKFFLKKTIYFLS